MKKFEKTLLKSAFLWAQESNCNRLKVGAVIAKDSRIISVGFNGTPAGFKSNDCEINKCNECGSEFTSEHHYCLECGSENYTSYTNPNVIHAEMNALMFAAKNGVSTDGCTLYVTYSPCINCAKHILQAGIKKVVYSIDYRDAAGVQLLKTMIDVEKIII
jgi:dCMP deaminase